MIHKNLIISMWIVISILIMFILINNVMLLILNLRIVLDEEGSSMLLRIQLILNFRFIRVLARMLENWCCKLSDWNYMNDERKFLKPKVYSSCFKWTWRSFGSKCYSLFCSFYLDNHVLTITHACDADFFKWSWILDYLILR